MSEPIFLTASQVAERLGYSYDYFRKKVRYWDDFPPPLQVPGRERWLEEDIRAYGRARRKEAA